MDAADGSQSVESMLSAAVDEATALGHARIGTEHLLLALLDEQSGAAAEALHAAGATRTAARHKVAEAVPAEPQARPVDRSVLTPRAQRAIERAGRFARQQRAREVESQHLLLGVLDVEGLACQVLRGLDVDIVRLGAALVPAAESPAHDGHATPPSSSEPITERPRCPRCRSLLDDTLTETLVTAAIDERVSSEISVVHCRACGETLGVLRPDWS